jgi:hypothetical protein
MMARMRARCSETSGVERAGSMRAGLAIVTRER